MKHVCIIGTCDTKHTEILYVRNLLHRLGISTCIVDVGVFEQALPPDAGQVVPLRERPSWERCLKTFLRNSRTPSAA